MPKNPTLAIAIISLVILTFIFLSKKPNEQVPYLPDLAEINQLLISPTPQYQQNMINNAPDQLQIQDTLIGTGQEVKTGDTIIIHYVGTLLNGQKFDSSYDRNQAFETQIGVGQLIKGWDLGIPGMKVGGKRKLIIPSDLAYGPQGAGDLIPPNSPLIFEVELVGIK